jgi:hypothetical protein
MFSVPGVEVISSRFLPGYDVDVEDGRKRESAAVRSQV